MTETKFQKIWKDPVWSKVIAAIIIAVATIIYNIIVAVNQNVEFISVFVDFWNIQIKLWIISILFIIAFGFMMYRNYQRIASSTFGIVKIQKDKFLNIFGPDILYEDVGGLADFTLIIPKLTLIASYNADSSFNSFPYVTSANNIGVRVEFPVPLTEVESMVDISASIVKTTGYQPKIKSDADVFASMDLSYCSIGGVSSKTHQLLSSNDNYFYEFNDDSGRNAVIDKKDRNIRYELSHSHDYAVIIKIHPRLFPNRVHICIAGMDTWGTRGACYYLANKLEELESKVGNKAFGAVIEVERGIIQSAELKTFKISS